MKISLVYLSGGKRGHKGRGKSFTNPEALERQRVKDEKEREWRKQRGEIDSDSSDSESEGSGSESGSGHDASGSEDGIAFAKEPAGASGGAKPKKAPADKGAKKPQGPPR